MLNKFSGIGLVMLRKGFGFRVGHELVKSTRSVPFCFPSYSQRYLSSTSGSDLDSKWVVLPDDTILVEHVRKTKTWKKDSYHESFKDASAFARKQLVKMVSAWQGENVYLLAKGTQIFNPLLKKYDFDLTQLISEVKDVLFPTLQTHLGTLLRCTTDPEYAKSESIELAKVALRPFAGDDLWEEIEATIKGDSVFASRSDTAVLQSLMLMSITTRVVGTPVRELQDAIKTWDFERLSDEEEARRYPRGSVVVSARFNIFTAPHPSASTRSLEVWTVERCIASPSSQSMSPWMVVRVLGPSTGYFLRAEEYLLQKMALSVHKKMESFQD